MEKVIKNTTASIFEPLQVKVAFKTPAPDETLLDELMAPGPAF